MWKPGSGGRALVATGSQGVAAHGLASASRLLSRVWARGVVMWSDAARDVTRVRKRSSDRRLARRLVVRCVRSPAARCVLAHQPQPLPRYCARWQLANRGACPRVFGLVGLPRRDDLDRTPCFPSDDWEAHRARLPVSTSSSCASSGTTRGGHFHRVFRRTGMEAG